jgi:hypothetical protein
MNYSFSDKSGGKNKKMGGSVSISKEMHAYFNEELSGLVSAISGIKVSEGHDLHQIITKLTLIIKEFEYIINQTVLFSELTQLSVAKHIIKMCRMLDSCQLLIDAYCMPVLFDSDPTDEEPMCLTTDMIIAILGSLATDSHEDLSEDDDSGIILSCTSDSLANLISSYCDICFFSGAANFLKIVKGISANGEFIYNQNTGKNFMRIIKSEYKSEVCSIKIKDDLRLISETIKLETVSIDEHLKLYRFSLFDRDKKTIKVKSEWFGDLTTTPAKPNKNSIENYLDLFTGSYEL